MAQTDKNAQLKELLDQLSQVEANEYVHLDVTSIVAALGGINEVIRFYLTHPKSHGQYFNSKISNLSRIINKYNNSNESVINISQSLNNKNEQLNMMENQQINLCTSVSKYTVDGACYINMDTFEHVDSPSATTYGSKNSSTQEKDIIIDYNNATTTVKSNAAASFAVSRFENNVIAQNRKQFYATSIVLCADSRNNLYYKFLNDINANWCVNLVLHKYYLILMTFITVILIIISIGIASNTISSSAASIMRCLGITVACIFIISLIFTMNLILSTLHSIHLNFGLRCGI